MLKNIVLHTILYYPYEQQIFLNRNRTIDSTIASSCFLLNGPDYYFNFYIYIYI